MSEDYDDLLTEEGGDDGLAVVEPKSARRWHAAIEDAERVFEDYQTQSDKIDRLYANLRDLANNARDREYQLFWANIQVMTASIYARAPIPVVVPKFKDRRPLPRSASELLERAVIVAFDKTNINGVMLGVRDDLAINARGVPWVRYETKAESGGETEQVCVEHVDRKDFLHEPARKWSEVGWVAKRAWLTKGQMRKRFRKTSGDLYQDADYGVSREERQNGGISRLRKCGVWEIWSKTDNRVYWITPGVPQLLDEDTPHLDLEGGFPCPEPAYGTLQRRSLIPVADQLFYRDQLEELNDLTDRMHSLADAVRVRGFYPSGASDIGDAVEAAVMGTDNGRVLIPVSNWAAFGTTGDPIIWLPLDQVTNALQSVVLLRRQIIEDIQQIMGISDIMRGDTDPNETLGAQELKSQYGSVRIRDKRDNMVRVARDTARITAEVMAEKFSSKTLIEMSQLEIPTDAEISAQVKPLEMEARKLTAALERAAKDPQALAQAEQDPEAAQQMSQQAMQRIQQIAQQVEKLNATPTIEQIMKFLRDNKMRPFVLDIETDSTIQADEQAEKAARTEFLTALGTMVSQFAPMIQSMPAMAPIVGEVIKFGLAPYRAGRELEGKIDEAIEQATAMAGQPQPNPEAEAAQAKAQSDMQVAQATLAEKQQAAQIRQQEASEKAAAEQQRLQLDIDLRDLDGRNKIAEHNLKIQNLQAEALLKSELHAQQLQGAMLDNEGKSLQNEKLRLEIQKAHIGLAQGVQSMEIAEQNADIAAEQAVHDSAEQQED